MKIRSRTPAHWTQFARLFLSTYSGRPTRLGVFELEHKHVTDYWIENGLPLNGLDVDESGGEVRVTITLGTLHREINSVSSIAVRLSAAAEDEGLDVVDKKGSTTILRFDISS